MKLKGFKKPFIFRLKNKELLKKSGDKRGANEKIPEKIQNSIPTSYINFKNKWLSSRENSEERKVKGWLMEKNQDVKEIKKLKKEKHKYNRTMRNQMGRKYNALNLKIKRLSRRIGQKKNKDK